MKIDIPQRIIDAVKSARNDVKSAPSKPTRPIPSKTPPTSNVANFARSYRPTNQSRKVYAPS